MSLIPADNLETALYQLAAIAWGPRKLLPSPSFVLNPASLDTPQTSQDIQKVIGQLHEHARRWAPGFEVPYQIPEVRITPFVDSAGQFRVSPRGNVFIEISPPFASNRFALFAVLAHETCHHILALSGVRAAAAYQNERLTDLAAFVCGFGELLLTGYSQLCKFRSEWTKVHLGYLSRAECEAAQGWVLRVQGLQDFAERRGRNALLELLRKGWARVRRPKKAIHLASQPPLIIEQRRKLALARLGGNRSALQRLLEYERRRQPNATELELLEAVIDSLERDRR